MEVLKIYKMSEGAHNPVYSTDGAACFDIKACLTEDIRVNFYNKFQESFLKKVIYNDILGAHALKIASGERCMIPTGLIFDLDDSQSLRIHPRSGLSIKSGIVLANSQGIVDYDYTQECFVCLLNTTTVDYYVTNGMRIAQGEIVRYNQVKFSFVDTEPRQKTNRVGGFGSTGVS
jgi:deoxyuridine 5'-triphosphate nucleotidohydrolase